MDLLNRALPVPDDHPALVSGLATWTRSQLANSVEQRARELEDEVRPGTVHAVTLYPDARGIIEMLAAWRLGAILAPLSSQLSTAERSAAVLALNGASRSGGIPAGTNAVIWTSGTTGRPRGVALGEAGMLANTMAVRERLELGSDDVWFASLSLAHVGGLILAVRALLLGSTLVAAGRFDLERLVTRLRGEDGLRPVTHLSLVPTQLVRLLDAWEGPAPGTVRCILVGGAGTPPDLLARALEGGWPVALTYGMTEMTSQVATATPAEVRATPGSPGKVLRSAQVSLGEDGEIRVKGPSLALGFLGSGEPMLDPEGWYHTGDTGEFDDAGNLWVRGRKSDRILSGGVTVDPHEVEAALREHPAIRDVCVVGIPDEEWGERVAAAVVPAGSGLDQGRIEEFAWERLGAARLPRSWRVLTHLPTNRNGKVDRNAIREILSSDD